MRSFDALFGTPPESTASAPGRVNLVGEHTDYNDGFVLPTAIPQQTTIELARRADRRVRVASDAADAGAVRTYRLGEETPGAGWLDYVQGCTRALAAVAPLGGVDLRISSTVPLGSGLSSSAALEVALLRALRATFAPSLDDVSIARLAHAAEHDFVGARVGVMDQMAASLADRGTALYLDTRTLLYETIPLPAALGLVVVDSGIAHRHAGGDYNTRRSECEAAAAALGVASLRDLPADVRTDMLPELLARRVRHVVTENARVHAAAQALRAGDVAALGAIFSASHASMRDDFAVSIPEIDVLVDVAAADPDVYGARLTGGGFGGSVVIAGRAGAGHDVGARTLAAYRRRVDAPARVLVP